MMSDNLVETSCPVCNGTDYEIVFHDRNRRDGIDCQGTYVQCRECSLVYLREHPPLEEIVRLYSSIDGEQEANFGKADSEKLQSQTTRPLTAWRQIFRKVRYRPHSWPLEISLEDNKRLLDLGCGSGAKLNEFAERNYEVWGIDVDEIAIQSCKEKLPKGVFLTGEVKEIDIPDGHFNYIRVDNALEHIPNPKEVLQECHRLLSKGGQIMVYVPHGRSLSMRLMKGNSISSWIPFHLQLFTKPSLKRLLNQAGFLRTNIYEYYPYNWLPMSIMQWRARRQSKLNHDYPRWLTWICYPIGWISAKIGLGEELVGLAWRE